MTLDKGQSAGGAHGSAVRQNVVDPLLFLENGIVDPRLLVRARDLALQQRTPVSQVLFSQGLISQEKFIRELANYHGLACLCSPADLEGYEVDEIDGLEGTGFGGLSKSRGLINLVRDGQVYVAFDVLHYDENTLQLFFDSGQIPHDRLLLITPDLRQLLIGRRDEQFRLHQAVFGLGEMHKGLSAKDKTSYMQKLVVAFLFGLLAGGLALSPIGTIYVLGAVLNTLFLYSILLRFVAVTTLEKHEQKDSGERRLGDDELPVYTILVPLFREHRVVGQLMDNLLALDYPHHKLDIKLIFEQGDEMTLAAARAHDSVRDFEFVIVPASQPQTKPKALNYALSGARGHYVVVYDAEDRPQADQLRKAVAAFARAGQSEEKDERPLICLQAGLNHYNVDENWLARQFTIEYTALFDGLLPALQRLDLPIPLGGTSNHFRTDLLRAIGGWDAFNVTEDADLGVRLMRFGYRCGILQSTTYEEACCRPRDWIRQRTRWLKGWLQTYLVHMRHPVTLFAQLGARGFAGFQIILGAQVLSLIAHPVFIIFMAYEAWSGHLFEPQYGVLGSLFWALALGNFILGYAVSVWLGFVTLKRRGYQRLTWQLLFMPLYWLLISVATFRALLHYVTKPFHWEKTEHGLGVRKAD